MLTTLIDFLIPSAHAADAMNPPPPQPNYFIPMFLVVLIVFLYFTSWRPQNKKAKELRELLSSLEKGDEVVTAGGIVGTVQKVNESYIVLKVSDTTEITLQKSSVVNMLPKGTLKSIL